VVLLNNAFGHCLETAVSAAIRRCAVSRHGGVHPPNDVAQPVPTGLLDSHLDVPADTAWAVAQMHDKGVSAATADVKFVVSHAGGKVPCLARRFALIDEVVVAASQGRNA